MQERNGEYIKNIIEQTEDINDNEELLEKLQIKLKRWKIFIVIEFCIFLAVILYSCSAGLNQNTIVPSASTEVTPPSDTPNESEEPDEPETTEEEDSDISIAVARIDIDADIDFSWEDSNAYSLVQSGSFDDFAYYSAFKEDCSKEQTFTIENVELIDIISENSVLIDSSFGAGDAEFKNHDSLSVALVDDTYNKEGGLYWKIQPVKKEIEFGVDHFHDLTNGASFLITFPSDVLDVKNETELNQLSEVILQTVQEMQITANDEGIDKLYRVCSETCNALKEEYALENVYETHFTNGLVSEEVYNLETSEDISAVIVNVDFNYLLGYLACHGSADSYPFNDLNCETFLDEVISAGYHK